ncbi:MAG: bifunctional SDR family oxidoreductase/aminotransferase class I/II-fold pyridoxal phosphate-dependent enzyme [Candidatus Omnitrophica bacterium]|nr:bifunctional SDR family oxidoreductase/aminotransferase class I/II-fold pyridoxal phosphate-dependent enzyme [Candidatus Omnitrophota bacterium]
MKKVLVTGGAGYLGSVLCEKLLEKSYSVRCFDRLYFGQEPVRHLMKNKNFELICGNIIDLDSYPSLLEDIDAVVHLAGIANDPTAELDPQLTYRVNCDASVKLAALAKSKNIQRFIFASSCSVYGKGLADVVNEDSPINPVSVYAESKAKAEKEILSLADRSFSPTSLRQATLYGMSPRMRFDLAINLMVLHAATKGKIFIWGGGDQWRPFLHVADSAEAMLHCLIVNPDKVRGKIYNVGSTKDNFKIIDLANLIKDMIKGTTLDVIPENPDKRSYCVNCDAIEKDLKWKPSMNIKDAVKAIGAFCASKKAQELASDTFYNIRTVQKFVRTPAIRGGDPMCPQFLPFSVPSIGKEEEDEVIATLRSGWLTTGPRVKKLEGMFEEYIGCKHAVCVNSCTAALHLSLVTLGIEAGDEVITSPITWPATANVIVHTGATPVFADVEKETLNIDPEKIEEKITKKTKAIIPVHMAGQPCRMDEIRRVASKHNLYVIEDAAHAIGAQFKGKNIGTLSDFTCFSFYPIKNMTTIEGGLVATSSEKWADLVKVYSLHGVSKDAWKRYDRSFRGSAEVMYPGFKYNMSDVQAALGLHQLPRLDGFIKTRELISRQYDEAFKDMEDLIALPAHIKNIKHAHHLYIIMLAIEKLNISRDGFIEALKCENVGVGIHFNSLHLQHYYQKRFKFKKEDFPQSAYLSERILSLPLYPSMTQYDIETVIKAVKKLIRYYKK